MCLSCGCGLPNEAHGEERHITYQKLVAAAQAANISPKQAAKNIRATLKASKDARATAEHELGAGPGSNPSPSDDGPRPTPAPRIARMDPTAQR